MDALRIPILKLGSTLIASIQAELHDTSAVQFKDDLLKRIHTTRAQGVMIDLIAVEVVGSATRRQILPGLPLSALMARCARWPLRRCSRIGAGGRGGPLARCCAVGGRLVEGAEQDALGREDPRAHEPGDAMHHRGGLAGASTLARLRSTVAASSAAEVGQG